MSLIRVKTGRIKQVQHCIVCFTQGSSCGLQELTADDLICIEKISDIILRSENLEDKLVICSVCKLTLQFIRKFIKMCQKTKEFRYSLGKSSKCSVYQSEPEFLDIKIVQSLNDLIDWVGLSMSQLDVGANAFPEDELTVTPTKQDFRDDLLEIVKHEIEDDEFLELPNSHERTDVEPEIGINSSIDINSTPCHKCGVVLENIRKLRRHLKSVHKIEQKEKFICDQCGSEFPSKIRLSYHLNGHYNIKPFFCKFDNCGRTFTNPSRLRNHKNEFHLKLITSYCDQCGRGFRTKAARDIHMKGHAEPTIPCEICGKLLTNKKTLTQHLSKYT